jgi:hypothetical protein
MHPLILDLTPALTALALTPTTAALLTTGRPIPDPWSPLLLPVTSYLHPGPRNHCAHPQKKRNPESLSAPEATPQTVHGHDRQPTPQRGTEP